MGRRSRQLSTCFVVFCLTFAACSGDDDDSSPQPTTTAPSTTQSQAQEDEQALRQLAKDWFAAVRRAYVGEVDPNDLEQFATDPYLSGVRAQITSFEGLGNEAQLNDQTRHEVISVAIDGDSAVLVECVIDADLLLSSEGEVVNDEVQANLYETDASIVDGSWLLTGRRTLNEVDGSDQCPAQ